MKKIVFIGTIWPEPKSTATGIRILQLLDLFLKNNFEITFASFASKSNFSFDLESLGIKTQLIEINNASFDVFIKEENPEIVVFDRFMTEEQLGWRVTEILPNCIKILDTEDLHFLRDARKSAFKKNIPLDKQLLVNEIFKREIAAIYRCDLTLIISKFELDFLMDEFHIPKEIVHYIPMFYKTINEEQIKKYPTFENRTHFVSIGNFLHLPNWEAVLLLKASIWSKIKKQLPESELHIYGAYLPEKAKQLNNTKVGFIVKGRAESSKDVFTKARVLLAPLPFGAGIKGKLIESMQYGTPNVTTNIGAEGMQNGLPWNGFIEDDFEDFATKAIQLYRDKSVWEQAQINGITLLNSNFNSNDYETPFITKINDLQQNLTLHRNHNFMGQILNHHTLKSTMYMSKWIEEKNSNK